MKKFHPFFTIGTVGIIVLACLHMFLGLGLSLTPGNSIFFTLYPLFLALLIFGVVLTIKNQKAIQSKKKN